MFFATSNRSSQIIFVSKAKRQVQESSISIGGETNASIITISAGVQTLTNCSSFGGCHRTWRFEVNFCQITRRNLEEIRPWHN